MEKTTCCRRVLIVTKLFYIAVNDFDAKESDRCKQVLVVNATKYSLQKSVCYRTYSQLYALFIYCRQRTTTSNMYTSHAQHPLETLY